MKNKKFKYLRIHEQQNWSPQEAKEKSQLLSKQIEHFSFHISISSLMVPLSLIFKECIFKLSFWRIGFLSLKIKKQLNLKKVIKKRDYETETIKQKLQTNKNKKDREVVFSILNKIAFSFFLFFFFSEIVSNLKQVKRS